jgi:hypothetical protein
MRVDSRIVGMLALFGCASGARGPASAQYLPRLSEAAAIGRAETFIKVNGYVKSSDADSKAIELERSLTFGSTADEVLPQRVGQLLPRACGVLAKPLRAFERGWTVIFCMDPRNRLYRESVPDFPASIRDRGRAVVMDETGSNVFVVHTDTTLRPDGMKRLPGMDEFERLLQAALRRPT